LRKIRSQCAIASARRTRALDRRVARRFRQALVRQPDGDEGRQPLHQREILRRIDMWMPREQCEDPRNLIADEGRFASSCGTIREATSLRR
jgi:hypothetical protein